MFYLQYFSFALIVSTLFALLEIQIEGKDGWATKLPTWRLYKPWFAKIQGGNTELTGYHTYLWLFLFVFIHVPYLFMEFRWRTELLILSLYLLILMLEDFLWFVFNPHFKIIKFHKEHVPWHAWFGPLPTLYYVGFVVWVALFFLALQLPMG